MPNRSTAPWVVALFVFAACKAPAVPDPVVREVTPGQGFDDAPVRITISGEGFTVASATDFQQHTESELDARYQALLGGRAAG